MRGLPVPYLPAPWAPVLTVPASLHTIETSIAGECSLPNIISVSWGDHLTFGVGDGVLDNVDSLKRRMEVWRDELGAGSLHWRQQRTREDGKSTRWACPFISTCPSSTRAARWPTRPSEMLGIL